MNDWNKIRSERFSSERPADWPAGVTAISMSGLALLGVHQATGKLYWDGKEIVIRNKIALGTFERWMAGLGILIAFVSLLVNIGHAASWWQ